MIFEWYTGHAKDSSIPRRLKEIRNQEHKGLSDAERIRVLEELAEQASTRNMKAKILTEIAFEKAHMADYDGEAAMAFKALECFDLLAGDFPLVIESFCDALLFAKGATWDKGGRDAVLERWGDLLFAEVVLRIVSPSGSDNFGSSLSLVAEYLMRIGQEWSDPRLLRLGAYGAMIAHHFLPDSAGNLWVLFTAFAELREKDSCLRVFGMLQEVDFEGGYVERAERWLREVGWL
ncbi:MAG: hypothetical protein ACP5NF_10365 [Thermoanaerobaculum sp.]